MERFYRVVCMILLSACVIGTAVLFYKIIRKTFYDSHIQKPIIEATIDPTIGWQQTYDLCANSETYIINGRTYKIGHFMFDIGVAQLLGLMKSQDPDIKRYLSHWNISENENCGMTITLKEDKHD